MKKKEVTGKPVEEIDKVDRVELIPKTGLTVLDHLGRVIPETGVKVVFSTFYSRLLKSGDVTRTENKKTGV